MALDFIYEETEMPPGMSCAEFRRRRPPATPVRRRRLRHAVRRLTREPRLGSASRADA
jgi:hypothetical protein